MKFHYNKTSLQTIGKQLKVRENALPTIKNKEAALRVEVKNAKKNAEELEVELEKKMVKYDGVINLWSEFDEELIRIKDVEINVKKIAGIKTPILDAIIYEDIKFSIYNNPSWYMNGIKIMQELAKIAIEKDFYFLKMELLYKARKKTTQKVNLYEKVQIPGYKEALMKIKRFLEDEENLSKAAQKIVKNRQVD